MAKISVVIPNYNNSLWLDTIIKSCLDQKGSFALEIIVVDDHSTDDSLDKLKELASGYPEIIHVYTNPSKGANSARNYGFSKSSGDFIQWLDSDDQLLVGKLPDQIDFMENNPDVDIVYSDWRIDTYNEERKLLSAEEVKREHYSDFLKILLQNMHWNPPNTYLLRREICKKTVDANGWHLDTKVGQDREFFTMAGILGAKYVYLPGVFSIYNRWSNETISTKFETKEIALESLKLNRKFYTAVKSSRILAEKRKYLKILNSELLNILYHHPDLTIPRRMYPWDFDLNSLHWKLRLISPILYLYHLTKHKVHEDNSGLWNKTRVDKIGSSSN